MKIDVKKIETVKYDNETVVTCKMYKDGKLLTHNLELKYNGNKVVAQIRHEIHGFIGVNDNTTNTDNKKYVTDMVLGVIKKAIEYGQIAPVKQ